MPHKFKARRPAAQAGFTLIEMLVVLSIIAALTAIATPKMRDYYYKGKVTAAVASGKNLVNTVLNQEHSTLTGIGSECYGGVGEGCIALGAVTTAEDLAAYGNQNGLIYDPDEPPFTPMPPWCWTPLPGGGAIPCDIGTPVPLEGWELRVQVPGVPETFNGSALLLGPGYVHYSTVQAQLSTVTP